MSSTGFFQEGGCVCSIIIVCALYLVVATVITIGKLMDDPESGTEHKTVKSQPNHVVNPLPRTQETEKEKLYQNLLAKARHDKNLADRLIDYERKCLPNCSQVELIKRAIERWERDNR